MPFHAFELSLRLIRSLRRPVSLVRRHNSRLAKQIEDAASSVAAEGLYECRMERTQSAELHEYVPLGRVRRTLGNLAEGNRRQGRDRAHFFRIAAGSADETRGHLLTAEAWGWLQLGDAEQALDHADHVLAILYKLTR